MKMIKLANSMKINILILRKENYMANTKQDEEGKMIKRQFTILSVYINEAGEVGKEKGTTISGDMAVSALNIIHNYINQLKTQIIYEDFGVNPSIKGESETQSQTLIIEICDDVKEMLLDKNKKYGDSALNPQRIFSKANTIEQINVRIDDKLSRLKSRQVDEDEDVEKDLLGYLILKKVAMKILNIKNEKEGTNENH